MAPQYETFLRAVQVRPERIPDPDRYPFTIPAICALRSLDFDPRITFLLGENGSGKSTLIEAIAVAAGFNAEGGSKNFNFTTRSSESDLWRCLRLVKTPRSPTTGYFLRAESFFNVATEIEKLDEIPMAGPPILPSYGGSLHEKSHGESFLALVENRFGPEGLYILDEPEAALSPSRQLVLLRHMHLLIKDGSQFIIATHSPILLAFPGALLYQLSETGIEKVEYEETEHYHLTRDFLLRRELFFRELFADGREGEDEED
jgi:predicted ATPase